MAYIGRDITSLSNASLLDDITFSSSAGPYNLTKSTVAFTPISAQALVISIDGVIQDPGSYTISGSTVTFDTSISSSCTNDFIVHNGVGIVNEVSDGAVTTAKLGTDAVTTAKILDNNVTVAKLPTTLDISGNTVTLPASVSGLGTGITASQLTSTLDISSKTITLPASVSGLGTGIDVTSQITGVVPSANLGSGTASSSTYLAGDSTYKSITAVDISWQSVTTGSTLTAVAGNGYPIDTTSNACAITLPASASVGDQIMFTDYAGNWATNSITFDINGLKYQGQDDTYTVEYDTNDQVLHIVYIDTTEGWMPILDQTVTDDVPEAPLGASLNNEGIIFGGCVGGPSCDRDISNKISNAGVVASDVTGVGTARAYLGACEFGEDKGIMGGGYLDAGSYTGVTNLVSNSGVMASDVTAVMEARNQYAAATFGGDKGIFFGGAKSGNNDLDTINLIDNAGVVASDTTAASASGKENAVACEYDAAKNKTTAIIAYGDTAAAAPASTSNLVSSVGVISADVTSISGTARRTAAACDYGGGSGIIGFGNGPLNTSNLITTAGVVGADVTGVGTARQYLTACEWGYTKGIFVAGTTGSYAGMSNLVSDTGVVALDVTAVATARAALGGCSFN
jgi:hypothetical protein